MAARCMVALFNDQSHSKFVRKNKRISEPCVDYFCVGKTQQRPDWPASCNGIIAKHFQTTPEPT